MFAHALILSLCNVNQLRGITSAPLTGRIGVSHATTELGKYTYDEYLNHVMIMQCIVLLIYSPTLMIT